MPPCSFSFSPPSRSVSITSESWVNAIPPLTILSLSRSSVVESVSESSFATARRRSSKTWFFKGNIDQYVLLLKENTSMIILHSLTLAEASFISKSIEWNFPKLSILSFIDDQLISWETAYFNLSQIIYLFIWTDIDKNLTHHHRRRHRLSMFFSWLVFFSSSFSLLIFQIYHS